MQPDFAPDFIFGPQDLEFVPNVDEVKVHDIYTEAAYWQHSL